MRRWLLTGILMAAVAGVGCSASGGGCAPVEGGVGVCLEGKPVTWSAGSLKPHMHENGGYYGSADDLARALGVRIEVSSDKKTVTIGDKSVTATAQGAKSIHLHEEKVFAPIKEFAEAAGFHAEVDTEQHTVNIRK